MGVLGNYKTYRVEAGGVRGKFRSSLRGFNDCLHELRARILPTAVFAW